MDFLTRRLDRFTAALVAVALCLAAYLAAQLSVNSRDVPLSDAMRLNTAGTAGVETVGNSIFYKEGASIHCVDTDGDFKWNLGVDPNAKFHATRHGIAVWSYKRFQIVDKNTGIARISTSFDGDILSAMVGDNYAAVVLAPEGNSKVVLTDLLGNVVDTITGLNGLTVLDYGFFEGQNLFWLMTLDPSGSTPTCTVATYKPGRSETGNISDMEQVIYKVQFRQNYIYAIGTSYVRVYDYKGSELSDMRIPVYGFTLEAVNEDTENPVMVFIPNSERNENIRISDMKILRGNNHYNMHFPMECLAVKVKGNTVYGFASDALCVGIAGSSVSNCYQLPVVIDGVIGITDDLTAVVTYGNSIYMFKLPEA